MFDPAAPPLRSDGHPDRRKFLRRLGAIGCLAPAARWLGCGASPKQAVASGGSTSAGQNSNVLDANGAVGTIHSAIDATRWATGGTAVMAATYPDPFAQAAAGACVATCQATAGPCYLASGLPPARADISEGQLGVPVYLGLRVLDEGCLPIAGAGVELWHTNASGIYSGDTPNPSFCSASDSKAIAADFCRGQQATGADGKVFFRTVFPGWYSSRTIHIHVRVRIANNLVATTQFFFDDSIDDGIVANTAVYKDRGSRDTTNQNDTVVSAAAAPTYCFDVSQLGDGVMLAYKTLVVRSSGPDGVCTIPAGSGGGGAGGQGEQDGMPGNAPPASGRQRIR